MNTKRVFFISLVAVIISLFTYYCGTTAVIEDQVLEDADIADITINRDAVLDVSKDSSGEDLIGEDIVAEDVNIPDSYSDIIFEDATIEEDVVLTDAESDVSIDAGRDGGGRDSGISDTEPGDASIEYFSISGRVTVNGGNPESGKAVYVVIFDRMPSEGVNPVAFTTTDSKNEYLIDGLQAGSYYVVAIYDINGDGNPVPESGDPFGYYANNPVVIRNASVTGIDIDIRTIQLVVASLFIQRQQSRNAYLTTLSARVLDPKTGEPLNNATVSVTDPSNQQNFNLTYNSNSGLYERQFNPYAQNAVIALEGDYKFTIRHQVYGSQPLTLLIKHRPQKAPVTITSPQNNSTIQSGEDLLVEWKNPSTDDINMIIQVLHRSGNQMQEVFRDDNQPIPNPYTIDGSYLNDTGVYIINVVSGIMRPEMNGLSIEATSGTVILNAQ